MSYIYLCKQGASISVSSNRFQVKYNKEVIQEIPVETVEGMEIFGNIQITTQAMQECLKRGIAIIMYSMKGKYYGRLFSTSHVNVKRQRLQASMEEDFKLELSKKIIYGKINNQLVVLRRYNRYNEVDIEKEKKLIQMMKDKVLQAKDMNQLMGFEGLAAREYFKAMGKMITPEFYFQCRSKQPPRDEFNSVISLGYTLLLNEIYGKIESRGLNPYFGLFHKDRENHPTLASDLLEEWRAILVDSTVMDLMNNKQISKDDFYEDEGKQGVFLTEDGLRICLQKLDQKINSLNNYLPELINPITFRQAIGFQVEKLIKAIEQQETEFYEPFTIR